MNDKLNNKLTPPVPSEVAHTPRIDESLYILSRQYRRTILLLDPFGGNPLQEAIDALDLPLPNSLPLDDALFKDDLQSAPLLLELLHDEPGHHTLLELSISLAQDQALKRSGRHPVCAWLFSGAALTTLRVELRQRLDVRLQREHIYFRYFDPRVMPRLAQILAPTADAAILGSNSFADLLGPVDIWCQLDRAANLICHGNPTPGAGPFGGYLRFDEQTGAAINRIEAVNMTARALAQRNIPWKQSDDGDIDMQLTQAKKLGLHEMEDQVAYAWRAVRFGNSFTLQAKLHEWIGLALTQGIPLDVLLDQYLPLNVFAEIS